jgi:hypothetical protein
LSAHALETSEPWRAPGWVRWLDLVLLTVALPVFLVADLPLLGWVTGAGVWLAQRAIQVWVERRAERTRDPRSVVGLMAGSMIGRGWLVALTIFAVGTGDEDAGLAAAVLVIALFTVYFTVSIIVKSLSRT